MNAQVLDARQVFLEAVEKHAPEHWPEFLDAACGGDAALRERVQLLLNAHGQYNALLDGEGVVATIDRPASERPGAQIGPYKLLQQIGEGGFGVVFMAEQVVPVRRKVALKVIKPGMDSRQVIARFEAERQALAVMDNPNIAKVLDAGATESGRPYFVMELVRGIPITQYCDENSLPVRERLELFATVCQAIQHAHTKGIIHRDIKPTNVLVTRQDAQAVVKVIDFGIAKAMGQQLTDKTLFTDFAQMIGTPLYMSPEQAELSSTDIDTRSDIYSLGVLLYELLTGSAPVSKEQLKQAAFDEVRRIIREDEPQKPSTRISSAEAAPSIAAQRHTEPAKLTRLVRGELDWIVMKALEKDRNRRYETASGFARDVERYLHDEPVSACPPSVWYRVRKFGRRNKAALVMIASATVALLAGTAISAWQAVRAVKAEVLAENRLVAEREARREAEINLRRACEAVDRMLTRVAEEKLIDVPSMEPVRRALLEDAKQFYEELLSERNADPEIRLATARTHMKLGWVQARFFETHKEQANYRRALDLLEPLVKEYPNELRYRTALANGLYLQANMIAWNRERWEEAEKLLRRAIDLQESVVMATPDSPQNAYDLAKMLGRLGAALHTGNQPEQAESIWRQVVTVSERATMKEPNHPGHLLVQLHTTTNIANLVKKRDPNQAEAMLLGAQALAARFQALPDAKSVFDEAPRAISDVDLVLGNLYEDQGRPKEAEAAYRRGVATLEKYAADFPFVRLYESWLANALNRLGWFLIADHRPAEAEAIFRRAWQLGEGLLFERLTQNETLAVWSLSGLDGLGRALREQHRPQESLQLYSLAEKLLDKVQAKFPDSPHAWPKLAQAYRALADSITDADASAQAEQAYRQAIRIYGRLAADFPDRSADRFELAQSYRGLGDRLRDANRLDEAEKAYIQALALLDHLVSEFPAQAGYRRALANTHQWQLARKIFDGTERPKEADVARRKALAIWQKLTADFPRERQYWHSLGVSQHDLAQYDEAVTSFTKAIELQPELWDSWHKRGLTFGKVSQWDKAITDQTKALELNPKDWGSWSRRGESYSALKQWDKAVADYDEAIRLGATQPFVWVWKAGAHAELKQPEQAITDLRQAIVKGFRDVGQLKNRSDLAGLRSREDFKQLLSELEAKRK